MEFLHTNRVIVLVDMDCFYCQVEEKLNPQLIGKPIAVVQYNAWRGGGIIAVNYPARDRGVTRHMRGNEAKEKCPDIILVSVPTTREKADLTKYRNAGKEVAAVLQTYTELLERASVDEAYMDITDVVNKRLQSKYSMTIDQLKNTHVVGCDIKDFLNIEEEHFSESNLKLCMGGVITEEIRAAVFDKTGYRCSAGIAHNKILAKLACGLHKPNQQTILPQDGVDDLFATLPLRKIRSLGGKFGYNLGEDLSIKTMGELKRFSEKELINKYDDKTGSWLYKIARGIELEPVTVRLVSKSIGCCKKFPGRTALIQPDDVHHWINELSIEISERLNKDIEENNRKAKHMIVGFVQEVDRKDISASRTHPMNSYETEKIAADMLKVINKHCLSVYGFYRIKYLGISAGKFEDCKKTYDISSYFKNFQKQDSTSNLKSDCDINFKEEEYFTTNQTDIVEDSNIITRSEVNDSTETSCNNSNENDKLNCNLSNDLEDSDSVFSQDTINLDINEADLMYNENYKDIDGFFLHAPDKTDKDSDTDSITNEIISSHEKINKVFDEDSQSYFSNYFHGMEHYNRNFDTSRHLEGDISSSESDTTSTNSSGNICNPLNDEKMKLLQSENTNEEQNTFMDVVEMLEDMKENNNKECLEETQCNKSDLSATDNIESDNFKRESNYIRPFDDKYDDTKEKCKECDKLILKSEMRSHMDYHFAIQIVRNEAHLYNNQNTVSSSPKKASKTTVVKSNKRKRNEVVSTKLTSFLQSNKSIPSDSPTEICPECNKVIVCDEFASHLDYHIAKKLHSEINPVTRVNITPAVPKSVNKKTKQVSKKQNKTQNVMSFFTQNT